MFGAKTQGVKKPKAWTKASDDRYDKAHGIKEGSPKDMRLDMKRGVPDMGMDKTLMKLRGGK